MSVKKSKVAVDDADEEDYSSGWLPLESNPDLLNAFSKHMGAPSGITWVRTN